MEEYHTLRSTQGDKYCDFSPLQTFDNLNLFIRHLKTKLVFLNVSPALPIANGINRGEPVTYRLGVFFNQFKLHFGILLQVLDVNIAFHFFDVCLYSSSCTSMLYLQSQE
jgi:hypothetical protein